MNELLGHTNECRTYCPTVKRITDFLHINYGVGIFVWNWYLKQCLVLVRVKFFVYWVDRFQSMTSKHLAQLSLSHLQSFVKIFFALTVRAHTDCFVQDIGNIKQVF